MKNKLIQASTKAEYQQRVAELLDHGYVIIDKTVGQAVLHRRTQFNGVVFMLGVLFLFVGALAYLTYYVIRRSGDRTVTVELIQA